MPIKTRLIVMLTPLIIILLMLITGYTQYALRQLSLSQTSAVARGIAAEESTTIQKTMVLARGYSETTAAAALSLREKGGATREDIKNLMRSAVEAQPSFAGMSSCWADFDGKNAEFINTENGNEQGQLGAYWSRGASGLQYDQLQGFDKEEYYTAPKTARKTSLTQPYVEDTSGVPVLMITVTSPIIEKGQVVGVTTVDLALDVLSRLLKNIRPLETGYAYVLTDKGIIVGHPDAKFVAKEVTQLPSVDPQTIMQSLQAGKFFSQKGKSNLDDSPVMVSFMPFEVLQGQAPWYFAIVLPEAAVLQEANSQLYTTLGICIVGIILAAIFVLIVAGKIARPIQNMVGHAALIAQGQYDNKLETKGFSKELLDLYQSLEHMIASLVAVMKEAHQSKAATEAGMQQAQAAMREAEISREQALAGQTAIMQAAENIESVSSRLTKAVEQLSYQMDQLSRSADQQQAKISASVSAMDLMSGTVQGVAKNADEAAKGSDSAKTQAQNGAHIVKDSITAISMVQTNTHDLRTEMDELGRQADSIGTIMGVISDIADQTNLLALNAAIEAARAGDAGRGFAVVADEVRKLAEKTMSATGEVGSAITGIQQRTKKSSDALAVTTSNLQNATSMVNNSGDSLTNIVNETLTMAEQIASIATATQEQSAASSEVNDSLADIMRNAENVTKVTKESATAVAELAHQAQELQKLVTQLRAGV